MGRYFYPTSWEKQSVSINANQFLKRNIEWYENEHRYMLERYGRLDPHYHEWYYVFGAACHIIREALKRCDPMIDINEARLLFPGEYIRDHMFNMGIPEPIIPTPMWADMMSATIIPSWLYRNKNYSPAGPEEMYDPPITFREDDRYAIINGEACFFDANSDRIYKGWRLYNAIYVLPTFARRIIYANAQFGHYSKKNRYLAISPSGQIADANNLNQIKEVIRDLIKQRA